MHTGSEFPGVAGVLVALWSSRHVTKWLVPDQVSSHMARRGSFNSVATYRRPTAHAALCRGERPMRPLMRSKL